MLPRNFVTIECVTFCVADLKKKGCVIYISEKKLSSYHGFIKTFFDYDGKNLCKVSKLHSGIEYVQIGLISLDTNDDNSKRTRVKTNRYTDNYIKRDTKK